MCQEQTDPFSVACNAIALQRTCSLSHALVGPNRTARHRLHAPPRLASPSRRERGECRAAEGHRSGRRRADRGAREGADGPELTQRSRRAGSSSRPVLGLKTQRLRGDGALRLPSRLSAGPRLRHAPGPACAEQADMQAQARHCRLRRTSGASRRVAASHCSRASCG